MASSGRLQVDVNPELIIWARSSIGYSLEEAAKKVDVPLDKLAAIEAGERLPSLSQLRRMANKYKRPLAALFLPEVPREFGVARLEDYRRLPEAESARSPALNRAVRKAEYRRAIFLDLSADEENDRRFQALTTAPDDPEELGERARRIIDVPPEVQYTWKDAYEALRYWRSEFGRSNILVFQAGGIDVSEMRGFSLYFEEYPVIVVNRKDAPNAKVFTLFHELAHLLVRQSGLCDLSDTATARIGDFGVEAFCNRAAAAALMPADVLVSLPIVSEWSDAEWPDTRIRRLARKFSVSPEVVLRRLLDLGRTTHKFYAKKRAEYQDLYKRQERRRAQKPEKGFLPPSNEVVVDDGPFFVSTVLEAMYRDRITVSDVSDYLDVRVKHLSKIEELVARDAGVKGAS